MKKKNDMVDDFLLAIKDVPESIVKAEKVTEALLNKKLTRKQKTSIKYKAALKNYKKSVTRYRRATTLLQKHYKILQRLVNKYGTEDTSE